MKGKLIKQETHYHLAFDKEIVGSTHEIIADKYKLSLKNCQSIECGYDLDEMADEWVFETNGHKWSNNDNTAGDNYASFKSGFQKALEILGDNNFSENEANKIWTAGQEYWKTSGESITFEELIERRNELLQQKEWDVVVVTEDKIALDGHTKIGVEPKLDAENCLILKRVE